MFFQETTPDTAGYMIAGYAATFLILAVYVASLYLRSRNVQQDMDMLEEMEQNAPKTETSPAAKTTKKKTKPSTKKGNK